MSTVTVELPDELATELERVVASGWFTDQGDAVREALRALLAGRRYALQERQQLDDVAWALAAKDVRR